MASITLISDRGLRKAVRLTVVLCTLFVLALGAGAALLHRAELRHGVEVLGEGRRDLAVALARDVQRSLQGLERDMLSAAADVDVRRAADSGQSVPSVARKAAFEPFADACIMRADGTSVDLRGNWDAVDARTLALTLPPPGEVRMRVWPREGPYDLLLWTPMGDSSMLLATYPLARLQALSHEMKLQTGLADSTGVLLCACFGKEPGESLQEQNPTLWTAMSGVPSGSQRGEDGLYGFSELRPFRATPARWYLLTRTPPEVIDGLRRATSGKHVFLWSSVSFVILGGMAFLIRMEVKNHATLRELRISAETDPLTMLLNRRAFMRRLEFEIARCERYDSTLSLLMGDIDHFKRVNDSFGHDAGDFVLKELSGLLVSNLRKQDIVCRWGGEEFVALLTSTDLEGAVISAEKIRRLIERREFGYKDESIRLTMSFGVVYYRTGITLEDLVKKADLYLYQSKQEGRNRVSFENTQRQMPEFPADTPAG